MTHPTNTQPHSHFQRIFVLTGAGISAESGLKTFRADDGLWENHRVEDVATPEAFLRDPVTVQRFYNQRRQQLATVEPNPAHHALAEFSWQFPGEFTLVTQNIDDLHERGGADPVIHMHGELLKVRCLATGQVIDWESDITPQSRCPCCQQTDNLRPHVVWFGEMPVAMERINAALLRCDLFVAIGTSGNVYPAAGFLQQAKEVGATTIELNLEPSSNAITFDHNHYGPASEVVPRFFNGLLSSNL